MSSLHDKTIRPGSLRGYSYYYSHRQPAHTAQVIAKPARKKIRIPKKLALALAIMAALVGLPLLWSDYKTAAPQSSGTSPQPKATAAAPVTKTTPPVNYCAGNTLDKLIKISIAKRRAWACEHDKTVHSASVITGLQNHAETETPLGTYHIYGKTTNTTLKGSDSRGSWSDPVYYWMPFLDNQYGTYGFHDATWRADSDFGNVSPDSTDASHGCIELPLASSKWLYEWAPVRTTVIVES